MANLYEPNFGSDEWKLAFCDHIYKEKSFFRGGGAGGGKNMSTITAAPFEIST